MGYTECCRLCRYYDREEEVCLNKYAFHDSDVTNLNYQVQEEGLLESLLEERLEDTGMKILREALYPKLKEWKVSSKRINEFGELFMENVRDLLKERLHEEVGYLYNNFTGGNPDYTGVTINNPSEFCCKEYE